MSRFKNDHLEGFAAIVTALGFKVVPSDYQCVDPKTFTAIEVIYEKAMSMTSLSELLFQDTRQGGLE